LKNTEGRNLVKSVSEISEYGFPTFQFLRIHVCLRVDGDHVQRLIRYAETYIIYIIYTLTLYAKIRADNLTAFICRLSWNLGTSASWNLQGLSRPV